MAKKEKAFLRARNRYNNKEEEVIYKHYYKSAKGYFFNTFFGKTALCCLAFTALSGLFFLLDFDDEDGVWVSYISYLFVGVGGLAYLINAVINLWFWKYSRNVVVTNQGIWIMIYSTGWWSRSWSGKKHFCSAYWSFYEWSELKGVFPFESGISKFFKLKNFAMDRWDGEAEVFYLKPNDVAEIEEYAKRHIDPKKRKKTRDKKRKFSLRDIFN